MFTREINKPRTRKTPFTLLVVMILLAACQVSPTNVTPENQDTPPIINITPTPNQSMEAEPDDGKRVIMDDPGVSFDLAQEATDFYLLSPTYFPETFVFLGVSVMNKHEAALNYLQSAPTERLAVLVQTILGSISQFNIVMETQNAQIVTVNGTDAIWIYDPNGDEGLLDWKSTDIWYRLVGITDLEEALKIAASLE